MKRQGQPGEGGSRNAPAVESMLGYAAAALQNGHAYDAERIARDVLARRRKHPDALQLLGLALLAQQRPAEATAPLEQSVRARPDAPGETYLALALLAAERSAQAMTLLKRATARRPPFPLAFYELGKLLQRERRLAEAEAVLKLGLEAAPGMAEFPLALAAIFLDRGDTESAKHAFAKALADAPGLPAAWHGLVCALKDAGEFDEAAERARQAFARDPLDAETRVLLATCLLELGKSEEAIEHFRVLVGTRPQLFGKALKAFADVGRGRLWLRPSAAAAFLRVKKDR
jgi:tetratricopeptide (TPR) repeat protein